MNAVHDEPVNDAALPTAWRQRPYAVRFEWGLAGAQSIRGRRGALVVVDVLSFTTAVCVAAERDIAVYPAPWHDPRAAELATSVDAALATGRRATTAEHPWSLSPAALALAPHVPRLVLPSPNGSRIAASVGSAADSDVVVVAASLRNASAVGDWLASRYADATIAVIAAGERWPDGTLRPAVEDLLGAGAVLSALARACAISESPEAGVARAAFEGQDDVASVVRACASGVELIDAGFEADVEIAAQLDASNVVPLLRDGAFRAEG